MRSLVGEAADRFGAGGSARGVLAAARAVAIGLIYVGAATVSRTLAEQFVPALLPFVFTVPAVIGATLSGGGLAGTTTLVCLQALTNTFVLPHWARDYGGRPEQVTNLVLATAGLALAVWATASFRTTQRKLRSQCESEVRALTLFAAEVDHRTRNNFQLAAALLHAQGMASAAGVRDALELAAARLVAIASIYGRLSSDLCQDGDVPLLRHVEELTEVLRTSLFGPGVDVIVVGEEVVVPAAIALTVGLVLNEWITNAAKYAFPEASGCVRVALHCRAGTIELEVRDDGIGPAAEGTGGTGSQLLDSVAAVHGGVLERLRENGTVCRLRLPLKR